MSCWLADLQIGPPTTFPLLGTGVPWVSLPGPTGVMTHPGRMMSHQSANPILLHCTGFLLRCTELRLDYTDCTLDVFTCNITKLDQCCVLIIRRKKSYQIETWLDVTCMAGTLNWNLTEANEFWKSCLEQVSQSLLYQVALINRCWVRLRGDSHKKNATMILASSTKTKNSFASIFGCDELHLLRLSTVAR